MEYVLLAAVLVLVLALAWLLLVTLIVGHLSNKFRDASGTVLKMALGLKELAEQQQIINTHFGTLVAEQCELKGKQAELETAMGELDKAALRRTEVN